MESGTPAGLQVAGRAALKGRTREGSVPGLGAEFLLWCFPGLGHAAGCHEPFLLTLWEPPIHQMACRCHSHVGGSSGPWGMLYFLPHWHYPHRREDSPQTAALQDALPGPMPQMS